jgi:uncharacterized protein
VISEPGSDLAQELWFGRYVKASSVLIYPEGMAALAAARRGQRLSQRLYRQAIESFAHSCEELVAIGVDERLTIEAGQLATDLALRGYDAVHLATALSIAETDVAMVSWDRDLAGAASEVGIPVLTE